MTDSARAASSSPPHVKKSFLFKTEIAMSPRAGSAIRLPFPLREKFGHVRDVNGVAKCAQRARSKLHDMPQPPELGSPPDAACPAWSSWRRPPAARWSPPSPAGFSSGTSAATALRRPVLHRLVRMLAELHRHHRLAFWKARPLSGLPAQRFRHRLRQAIRRRFRGVPRVSRRPRPPPPRPATKAGKQLPGALSADLAVRLDDAGQQPQPI